MFRLNISRLCAAAGAASVSVASRAAAEAYKANISISQRAWDRIRAVNAREAQQRQQQQQPPPESGASTTAKRLRMGINSGGCHGFQYEFKFDAEAADPEEDVVFSAPDAAEKGPAEVVIDKPSLEKLEAATLDYLSELKGAAFLIVGNALVDEECACKMSISLRKRPKKSLSKSGSSAAAAAASTISATTSATTETVGAPAAGASAPGAKSSQLRRVRSTE